MNIMHLLLLYCMTAEAFSADSDQAEADDNEWRVAENGQDRFLILHRGGKEILAADWAKSLVKDMAAMNQTLRLGQDEVIAEMTARVDNLQALHAAQMVHVVENEGYVAGMSRRAQAYKKQSWQNIKDHSEAFEKDMVRFKDAVPGL
jgi:gamma-glutamylcysteine synthetase